MALILSKNTPFIRQSDISREEDLAARLLLSRPPYMGGNMWKSAFVLLVLFSQSIFASGFIAEMDQPLDRAFIPVGFDNDDSIEIVVTGKFRKPCLQLGIVSTEVEDSTIWVQLTAYEYEGSCSNAGAPFQQTVPLGLIQNAGIYSIKDRSSGKEIGSLIVDKASDTTAGTDSNPYASLSDAFLTWEGTTPTLVLRGLHNSTCAKFGKIEITPQKDALVVLPILKKLKKNEICDHKIAPFEMKTQVSEELPFFPFLLHVRSMGGQAISKMVYGR